VGHDEPVDAPARASELDGSEANASVKARWVTGAGVLLLAVTFAALLVIPSLHHALSDLAHGNLKALRVDLRSFGGWGAIVIFALVLAHTVLPFPAEILAVVSGFAFGFALALPLLEASFVISALLAYAIGRWAGRPLVFALIGGRYLGRGEVLVGRAGWRGLIAIRLFPLMPFSPVCLVCGLARVPSRRYLWTSAVGILPELALVSFLGARLQSPRLSDPTLWAPLAGLLLLVLVSPLMIRQGRRTLDGAPDA
jgi:uncharacterized membrane protein YdjX (TVP38/TMEM64 family)